MKNWNQDEFFENFAGPAAFLLWNGRSVKVIRYNRDYVSELGMDCSVPEDVDLLCTIDENDRVSYRNAVIATAGTHTIQYCETIRHSFSQLCGSSELYIRTKFRFVEDTEEGSLIFASVRDITGEKQLKDIEDSEARFRFAAEQANVYAWEYDIRTKQMRPCYRCMRDLGLPALLENYPEPAIEKGIFPPDYADMYRDWHCQLTKGAEKLEAIIPLTPARVPFHVRYTTLFDENGKPVKAYGSATQVVDSEKEQEYLEIIGCLGKAYFGLYYLDLRTGDFHQLEKASLQSTEDVIGQRGKAPEAFLRMSQSLVVPEMAEEVLNFTDYTTVAERLKNRDTIGIHFIGTHIGWCEGLFVAAKRDENGICTHAVWGVRSIQQEKAKEEQQKKLLSEALKQTEDALEEAKRANAARTSFLSRMSHDIRTPLNGIIGLIEIDERHPEDVELLRSNRAKSKLAANHLLSLISDVLELTKIDDKNVTIVEEPFDLRTVAKEVCTIAGLRAGENSITLHFPEFTVFEDLPYVFGSPLYVKQLLLNIVGNAIKYNRPNGSVSCSVSKKQEDDRTVRYTFTIADTGIGMSEEFLRHIYEPFTQERSDARSVYQGTGLGMAIVRSLVDKMHGTIHVQSQPDIGTTFTISIPFRIACASDMPVTEEKTTADISGARVLVAEDNDLNMDILVTILQESGVQVTGTWNGREVVDTYANSKPGSFDLILMDLMMPVLDGFGATAAIRAMDPPYNEIPIVAMTANAFADDVRKCLACGMNDHLAKPININKLISVIARYKSR